MIFKKISFLPLRETNNPQVGGSFAFAMWKPLAAVALFAAPSLQSAIGKTVAPLRFSKNGTFQISILEDLHFGESKSTKSSIP